MKEYLNSQIDSSTLIMFRFVTSFLLIFELINGIVLGKIVEYSKPLFHFSYLYTPFIKPFPLYGIYLQYLIIFICAICVGFGKYYRITSTLLFISFTHLFLSEMSEYINHAYLYVLMLFWLMVLPLGKKDIGKRAPRWMLLLIIFHISLAYFFAGVAKLNSDWLSGTPMDIFLSQRNSHPLSFFYNHHLSPLIFSWGGVIFDLTIVFFLIIPKTRLLAFSAAAIFHISNVFMFGLASFPWYCLIMTSLFFKPSWPKEFKHLRILLGIDQIHNDRTIKGKLGNPALIFVVLYLVVHLSLPFRFMLYPHPTSWSEEAHQFSWRMMLRTKKGNTAFLAVKEDGKKFIINQSHYLTHRQIEKMSGHPDMILQFAHFIKDEYKKKDENIKIYALSSIALNNHEQRPLINPTVDLTKIPRTIKPYTFIEMGPTNKPYFDELANH